MKRTAAALSALALIAGLSACSVESETAAPESPATSADGTASGEELPDEVAEDREARHRADFLGVRGRPARKREAEPQDEPHQPRQPNRPAHVLSSQSTRGHGACNVTMLHTQAGYTAGA